MKYRSDFVTNSSSSSFIVVYKTSAEMVKDLSQFAHNFEDDEYSNQYKSVVYDIFRNKITYTEALKMFTRHTKYALVYKIRNSEYVRNLINSGKYSSFEAFKKSAEYKEIYNKELNKELLRFKENVTPKSYISYLNYSDSDGFYDVVGHLDTMLKGVFLRSEE